MKAIDVFAGAGGLSLGAIQAGIEVVLAVEQDKHAAAAYQANHSATQVSTADIRKVPSEKFGQIPRGTNGTMVFGGPPCQGFSYSNTRTRTTDNQLNWLYTEFLRVIDAWQPLCFVFENVKGITNFNRGTMLTTILEAFQSRGFNLVHGILNAKDFGVPQDRNRFFMIGSRDGVDVHLPSPTDDSPPTVSDAIADLPELANGSVAALLPYSDTPPSDYAKDLRGKLQECTGHLVTKSGSLVVQRYAAVKPGNNWQDIPSDLMQNYTDQTRCHTGIYHRLRADRPSIVIGNFRKNMVIHPNCDRGLSVREAARIQSFPDNYTFSGSIGFQQQQVGNAVPPKLARSVFLEIVRATTGDRPRV